MRYPKLVRKDLCKTPVIITIYSEDIGEDGQKLTLANISTLCNYQSNGTKTITDTSHNTKVNGTIYLEKDYFENIAELTDGEVVIFGESHQIINAMKARNPDGTVNYVKLEIS